MKISPAVEVTVKDPVVPPNVIGLPRVMFPAAFKITVDPGLKLTNDAPLVVMAPGVPVVPGADRLKGPLPVLVIPSVMAIKPFVAVAEKLPEEPKLSGPEILTAFEAGLEAMIVILPNPEVVIGEVVELVEKNPLVA